MQAKAQLCVTDMRRATRCPVDYATTGDHLGRGEIEMHLCNISTHGFMLDRVAGLARGDRVVVRLPVIGRLEGCCAWTIDERAGFQFERILRPDDFAAMLLAMQPNKRLRRRA